MNSASNKTDQFGINYSILESRLTKLNNNTNEHYYSIGLGLNIAAYYGLDFNLRIGFQLKR